MERELRELDRLGQGATPGRPGRGRLRLRRLGLTSTARTGCLLGCIPALPAAALCTAAWLWTSNLLLRWLRLWETVTVNVLGVEIARIDVLELTRLTGFYSRLVWLEDRDRLLGVLSLLGLSLVGGLIAAAVLVVLALAYNLLARLFGGISIEVDTEEE